MLLTGLHEAASSGAFGQEPTESFRLSSPAGLPANVEIELALRAAPLWRTVEDEIVSVAEIFESVCGEKQPEIRQALVDKTLELNRIESLDRLIPVGSSVAIPFCLKPGQHQIVEVNEGDTIESLLRSNYGVPDEMTRRQVYHLNAEAYRGMTLEEFEHRLRPSTTLVFPIAAQEERTLIWEPRPDDARSFPDFMQDLHGENVGGLVANRLPVNSIHDPHKFRSIPFVSAASTAGGSVCGIAEHAEEVRRLIERYRFESEAFEAAGGDLKAVIVGVVDTGIELQDAFFEDVLERNEVEDRGDPLVDDDQPPNFFKDDVFGVSLENRNGWIYSSPTDRPLGHGTKIATVVVAGPDFEIWRGQSNLSPIRLKIVSYSSTIGVSGVAPETLTNGIPYLRSEGAAVVNMSLSSSQDPVPLSLEISRSPSQLFVAAAGNVASGGGRRLGLTLVYPALYGGRTGDFSRRVLTVGAHDETGGPAGFSNYSTEYVDLLAPGCGVKTRDPSGETVREDGTSISTAVVSFGAALVHSLGLRDPSRIKNRLLAAATFDPRLADHSWSSSRLDLEKAVSLRSDVVELADGRRIFGRLRRRGDLVSFCGNPDLRPSARSLRKIVANLRDPESVPELELWIETGGRLYRVRCRQANAQASIGPLVVAGETREGPPISEVQEIVLAAFKE